MTADTCFNPRKYWEWGDGEEMLGIFCVTLMTAKIEKWRLHFFSTMQLCYRRGEVLCLVCILLVLSSNKHLTI